MAYPVKAQGGIVRFIKINDSGTVGARLFDGQEPSRRVGRLAAGLVCKNDKEFVPFFQRVQGVLPAIDREQQLSGCMLLIRLPEDIRDQRYLEGCASACSVAEILQTVSTGNRSTPLQN